MRTFRTWCAILLALLDGGGAALANDAGLDDPMRPSYVRAPIARQRGAANPYRLQAVMGDGQERIAIINGRVLRAGERVGAATVQHIGADHVELRAGRALWRVRLPATLR